MLARSKGCSAGIPRSTGRPSQAAGNVYRHEYESVDEALVWHTVRNGLTALRSVAEEEFLHLQADVPPNNRTTDGLIP